MWHVCISGNVSRFATDLLRVIAATFIIFNHTAWPEFMNLGTAHESWWSHGVAWVNQLGKPSVLIFIFLSGFAFGHKKGDFSARSFYLSRALRILPLYVIVSAVGIYQKPGMHWWQLPASLLDGSAMFHLYFVALLFYIYLLYPLLRKIPFTLWTLIPFLSLLILPELYGGVRNIYISYFSGNGKGFIKSIPMWGIYFSYGIPFFQAGLWLAGYNWKDTPDRGEFMFGRFKRLIDSLPVALVILSATYALLLVHFYNEVSSGLNADTSGRIWRISVVLYAAGWVWFMNKLRSDRSSPFLRQLARAGYMVYLLHPFGIQLTRDYLSSNPFLHTAAVAVLTWSATLLLHEVARRNTFFGFFLGEGDRIIKTLMEKRAQKSILDDEQRDLSDTCGEAYGS